MNNFAINFASKLLNEHGGESDLGKTTGAENAFDASMKNGSEVDQETISHLYGQIEKFSDSIDAHLNDGEDASHAEMMKSMKELFETITQYAIDGKLKPNWTESLVQDVPKKD